MLLKRAAILLQPQRRSTPDRWAAANRTYPRSAAIPGPRDPTLTPYVIEPECAVAEVRAKRIVMVTSAQEGKTDMMLDLIGHRLDQNPAPILYVGPNKQFLTEQFEPRIMGLLDDAPTLAMKVVRGKRMTKTRKIVAGVPLRLAHAGSASALKSDPAALALIDEYDGMLENIHREGNPVALVERRGDTYPNFVCVVTSTPKTGIVRTEKDIKSGLEFWAIAGEREDVQSPIWQLWQQGTRHHWAWPCPHCGDYFIPRFDRMRYRHDATPTEAAEDTWLECPHCGCEIRDGSKAQMNERGRYVAPGQTIDHDGIVHGDPPRVSTLSYWVSGLASPFVSFGDRAKTYLEALALGDDAMVQAAVSSSFGELYAPGGVNIREWEVVAKRRGLHRFKEVPAEVIRVTAAVDVQKTGFYFSVRGWGQRASSWQLDSGEIHGFTDEPAVWNDLADFTTETYGGMPISLILVDSGFRPDRPEQAAINVVYDFCRRFRRNVRPTKGFAHMDAPIKKTKLKVLTPGHKILTTIELIRLHVDFFKLRVHERLQWPEDQPGALTLSADASDDYCKQLVSEHRHLDEDGKPEWIRISRRNHFFDCEAMNEAAGVLINAARIPLGTVRAIEEEQIEEEIALPEAPATKIVPPPVNDLRTRMRGFGERLNR